MSKISCLICHYECGLNYLGTHLKKVHDTSLKKYYDIYIKLNNEGTCVICEKSTKFRTLKDGYTKTCKGKCTNEYVSKKLLEKHGVSNYFQLDEVKQKLKETLIEKYGVANISQLEEIKQKKKQTTVKNYGVEYPSQNEELQNKYIQYIREKYNNPNIKNIGQVQEIKNKIKKTKKERYGDEFYTNRKKAEDTIKEIYGVSNVMFVEDIAQKAALNGGGKTAAKKYITKFGDEILVQGSYEKKFVEYCEEHNYRIINGPTISYIYDDLPKKYRIDFLVEKESKKILVEIKSSYWYSVHKDQVETKKKFAEEYAAANNLSYLLLVEKWKIE